MRLLFNCDRALALIAADASICPPAEALSERQPIRTEAVRLEAPGERSFDKVDAGRDAPLTRLAELIRGAVVGEPVELELVLAVNTVGWSPSGSFAHRDEAVALIEQSVSSLAVEEFHIDVLRWCDPLAFAAWRLRARQPGPLLINDDVLVEATNRPVLLTGATLAEIRFDQSPRSRPTSTTPRSSSRSS